MGYGGIEKSIVTLSNMLAATKKYQVEIISIYELYKELAFPLSPDVKVTYLIKSDLPARLQQYKILLFHGHFLKLLKKLGQDYFLKLRFLSLFKDTFGGIFMYPKRSSVMKKALKKCSSDVIISTRTFLNDLLGEYGHDDSLKIGWEHNHHHNNMKYAVDVVRSVKKLHYLVVVSKDLKKFYQKKLLASSCQCVYIPNTLDHVPETASPLTGKRFISVGRLSQEKGQLDLLNLYQSIHKKYPDWQLDLIGDGPERETLEKYVLDNHLEDSVVFHGFQKSAVIDELMKKASLYLMTSYTESFGIVLLEAMSNGLPCLAYDSAEGAREVITSGRDGYLIHNRNKKAMLSKMEDLMLDGNKRKELGDNGRKKIKIYSKEKVLKQWIQLLNRKD